VMKLVLAMSYPIFCFDIYYNFGRQFGNFLVMPKNLNDLLSLNEGKSIQSLQTHLFVKRCVYDEILIHKNKTLAESWDNSYFVKQVFGKSNLRIKKFKRAILSLFNNKKETNENNLNKEN